MFIMVRDYDNGEDGYDSYSCCDELITEKDRVKIFSSSEEARKYAIQKYHNDINNIITNANGSNSVIIKDDENTFMYINPLNERVAYKWVNLSDPNMII